MKKFLFVLSSLFITPFLLNAQSTFSDVVTLLNANCSNSGCHSSVFPQGGLDLSGTAQDVYLALINKNPINNTASGNGNATA